MRFVIFSSYGNDSCALIQWAHKEGLEDVTVVYSDTQWAATWWMARVERMEKWAQSLGFKTDRTSSIGFKGLARQKKAFPTQMVQWCSGILKIEPGERWLEDHDPDKRAVCLVGVRREEGEDRKTYPHFMAQSPSHGGRVLLAPMADWTVEVRDSFLDMANIKPLPHRSMECSPCINANREDIRILAKDEERISEIADLEDELGINGPLTKNGKRRGAMFRPSNKMGAVGIREVVKWAVASPGKYRPSNPDEISMFDKEDDLGSSGCVAGWCGS